MNTPDLNNPKNPFLANPYLAMVLAIVIVLCGILAMFQLPLAQYPNVTPPQISVSLSYPGADALTLLHSVLVPLEQQINGAPDLLYLDSYASNSGTGTITATFKVGSDVNVNLQHVQSRVDWAAAQLPDAVQNESIEVRQKSSNMLLGVALYSPNRTYDALFMSNYGTINLQDTLERIPGVAQVQLFGSSCYALRVWLNYSKCAGLGITPAEVIEALKSQNIQVSSGTLGGAPAPAGQNFTFLIQTQGRLPDAEAFQKIIVRSTGNGAQVKLADLAEVTLAANSYTTDCSLDRQPAVMMLLFQTSDSNALAISEQCRKIVASLSKDFPPDLSYGFQYDTTGFVRVGIMAVVRTLVTAIVLVSLVTFIFLQDWRMTLIPTLAIPVSIIGTFGLLYLLDYSINLVTLFALTLAIGIVVDDSIIVIENVSRLMDTEKLSPAAAAQKSLKQISGAVIATTLVLLAMFVPICFFPGITGKLYRQFGVTISAAVLLSAFNALTLSPALSALLLKPHEKELSWSIFHWFNTALSKFTELFQSGLRYILKHAKISVLILLILSLLAGYFYQRRPTGFIPDEDQGYAFVTLQLPPGSSLERTKQLTDLASGIVGALPIVEHVIAIPGFDILDFIPASSDAMLIVMLKPWSQRRQANLSVDAFIRDVQIALAYQLPEVFGMAFAPPAIPGIGLAGGFNFVLEQTGETAPAELARQTADFLLAANRKPELQSVFAAYRCDTPGYYLQIDRAKVLAMQIDLTAVNAVLENAFGYSFINEFNRFGQIYQVNLQSRYLDRATTDDLLKMHVANRQGQMVPLASLAQVKRFFAPNFLSRHNLRLAVTIQGAAKPPYSSGEAMAALTDLAGKLPKHYTHEWTGMSYQAALASGTGPWILLLAIGFIFLFLAALYASWLLPLTVLPAIFPALTGALIFLTSAGESNNLYTQIGIVLLFGMACKTAILVVDFARAKHQSDSGISPGEAALHGAKLRFRAVMMTSFAFICGMLPLLFAFGPSSGSQKAIGLPVVGGMFGVIVSALLVSPLLFALGQNQLNRRNKKTRHKLLLLLTIFSCAGVLGGCYTPPENADWIERRSLRETKLPSGNPAFWQNLSVLTVDKALEIALANNPDYRSMHYALTAAKMRYYQSLGAYSPQLTAAVAVGQQFFDNSDNQPERNHNSYNYTSIGANLLIFDGLIREFEVLASLRSIDLQEQLSENARRLLIQSVYLNYDQICAAQTELAIAQSNWQFQSAFLHQIEAKYNCGETAEDALLSARSAANSAQQSVLQSANQYEVARFALAALLGYPESEMPCDLQLTVPFDWQMPALRELDFYLDHSLTHRPDLNAVRTGLTVLKYRYYQSYAMFSPVLSLFASYSYSSSNIQYGGNNPSQYGNYYLDGNYFNYGGMAAWEVFSGLTRYNQLREGRNLLNQAYFRASNEWLKVVNEIRSAYSDCFYAAQRAALAQENAEIQLRHRDLQYRQYQIGESDHLSLLRSQNQLVQSQSQALQSRIDSRRAWVRLCTAAALPLSPQTSDSSD